MIKQADFEPSLIKLGHHVKLKSGLRVADVSRSTV
jgi:hypothetical protein